MRLVNYFSILILTAILLQGCSAFIDPTDNLLESATLLENEGKYVQAEEAYGKAYQINSKASPMQLAILLNEARFFLRTKNYQKAILLCRKGLEVCRSVYGTEDMLNASFLFVLASTFDQLKDYKNAETNYKTIMTMSPFSCCRRNVVVLTPLIKMGDINFKQNNLHEASELYRKAYAVGGLTDPICRLIFYRLALVDWVLGQNDDAEFYFRQALPYLANQAAPQQIYLQFGSFLTKAGKFGSAGFAANTSDCWSARRKEYLDWYAAKSFSVASAPRLLDVYTERDYDLIDSIRQNLALDSPHAILNEKN